MQKSVKRKWKFALFQLDETFIAEIKNSCEADLINAIQTEEKHAREDAINAVKNEVIERYTENEADEATMKQVKDVFGSYGERRSASPYYG